MGTRADFYIGRGPNAEWIGSVAWDAYPSGIPDDVLNAKTEADFRAAVADFFSKRDDVTLPDRGWPWPWDNSGLTDYTYAIDGDQVWASRFGREWWPANQPEPEDAPKGNAVEMFPDMKDRKNVRLDRGSGVIVVRGEL